MKFHPEGRNTQGAKILGRKGRWETEWLEASLEKVFTEWDKKIFTLGTVFTHLGMSNWVLAKRNSVTQAQNWRLKEFLRTDHLVPKGSTTLIKTSSHSNIFWGVLTAFLPSFALERASSYMLCWVHTSLIHRKPADVKMESLELMRPALRLLQLLKVRHSIAPAVDWKAVKIFLHVPWKSHCQIRLRFF